MSPILCMMSCERDFIEDDECITSNGGNSIGGWESEDSMDVNEKIDTVKQGFDIKVDEWGDTLTKVIKLK